MPIDRPDFSTMFDARGNALVPADNLPADPADTIKQIAAYDGSGSTPDAPVPATTTEPLGKRVDFGHDRQGREIPLTNEHGLPAEIAREMHASADGYDAQLAMMQASAAKALAEMPPHFAEHFEKLSPGIQTKAYRALRQYPHLDIYGLLDKVQPTLTLSEMAEAQNWIKGLKR